MLTSSNALAKTAVGTPYYLSPEMCDGKPYDQKSDVWALGCVLYEMVTLRRAFDGNSLPALIVKARDYPPRASARLLSRYSFSLCLRLPPHVLPQILRGKYPPPPSSYSSTLRDLIAQMLNLNPAQRPTVAKARSRACSLRRPRLRRHACDSQARARPGARAHGSHTARAPRADAAEALRQGLHQALL